MAARTAAPADPVAAPQAPPAPELRPTSPVLAWPAEWPVPTPPEPTSRARRRAERGLPMAPTLAAAGNTASLLATGAYEAGGVVGLAATGVVAAAGATAAVVRRRATVRRNLSARANNRSAANWPRSGGASGGRGGSLLSGGGRSSGGSRGASGTGSTGSGYRAAGRSGGASSGLLGGGKSPRPGGGSGGNSPAGSRTSGLGPSTKSGAKKPGKTPSQTLAAAARRAAKSAAKPQSRTRKTLAAVGHGTVAGAKGVGRGTKKALTSHPAKTAARKTRAGAKHLHGVAVDGVRSILSAAWTGIKKRDRHAALARLKDVWARRRKNRAAKNTKPAPTPTKPQVATNVRRPTATTTAPSTPGGTTTVSGHHFVAPAMEMARIAANYDPQGMLQVGADFAGLEEALRLTAEAMKATVENADAKQPLAPQIIDQMRQIHSLQLKAAELASELGPAFEKLHAVDLERLRNPRKGAAGERMWDVTANII